MGYTIPSSTGTKYTRSYTTPLGVDRDGDGSSISPTRLAYAENMYRDYTAEGGGVIESVPGFRTLFKLYGRINGIFTQRALGKEYLIVHTGNSLFRISEDENGDWSAESIGGLNDRRTRGFCEGECLYILDSDGIYKVEKDGICNQITEGSPDIYVPTTYINGVEYEQRNLLTNNFREEFTISDPWDFSYGTQDVIYTITDPEAKYCAVCGVNRGFWGQVNIPKYVDIGGIKFQVKEILESAFDAEIGIISLRVAEGIEKIGNYAFRSCSSLKTVTLPDSLREIGIGAFSHCKELNEVYLGGGLERVGDLLFEMSQSLDEVNYSLDEEHLKLIENYGTILTRTVNYRTRNREMYIELPLHSDTEEIISATLDGENIYFDTVYGKNCATGAILRIDNDIEAYGKTVVLEGTFWGGEIDFHRKSTSFLDTGAGKTVGGFDAVTKCTIAERFDGRVFLSGNPDLPNTVFYSERDLSGENNPLYIGVHNFFNDGTGYYPTVSMLAVKDALAVFKADDDGEGSIFYHTPMETDSTVLQKVYKRAYVHSGVCSLGESISFLDDPVFLSPLGLSALTQPNISYERSIATRSHNVNRDLLTESLKDASLAVWCGYLAIGTRGKIYLADSRATFRHETGNSEYEWFILSDIGTYSGDSAVWRYASFAPEGYQISDTPDEVVTGTVYSEDNGNGYVHFVKEDGKKYTVYNTEQRCGGKFSPAIIYHAEGDRLFFGTESGDLCVFNNDLRGKPPERLLDDPDFDITEYERSYGNKIHPDFYSFAGHAPRYVIQTALDNCGIPHLEKNTVKGSLCVKCKGAGAAKIHLEAGTDKNGYSEIASFNVGEFDFGEIDFSALTLESAPTATITFKEKEKRWVEKQITLYSESYASPIGIYSISYRYTVGGSVRNK